MKAQSAKPRSNQANPPGRRRNSSKHSAILQATRQLLEESGYKGLSISAIARRAMVTRNVLYNWWDGDINLIVEDALLPNVQEWEVPDTGVFKNDIDVLLDLIIDVIHRPCILKGFLIVATEIVSGNNKLRQSERHFRAPYVPQITKIIKNAEARNEIKQGLNPTHIAQIISGSITQLAISKQAGRRKTKTILSDLIVKLASK